MCLLETTNNNFLSLHVVFNSHMNFFEISKKVRQKKMLSTEEEEEDALARSNKVFSPTPAIKNSYWDSLYTNTKNANPKYFSQTTNLYKAFLHDESTRSRSGVAFIPITTEDKQRMYKKWVDAIIVKFYGRRVGYKFLQQKHQIILAPSEEINLIDLRYDFFLINFEK